MSQRIYRINIDDYNESNSPKNVFISAQLDHKIIDAEVAHEYNVCVEKAEFSISSVPMFLNKGDLKIDFLDGVAGNILRTHTLEGNYLTIPEFIEDLNSKMSYMTSTPTPILRSYGLFSYDQETELITHTMTSLEVGDWYSSGHQVRFSSGLQFLLDFGLLSTSGYLDGFKQGESSIRTQYRSTRGRFYQMKAIRIFCPSLSTNPYYLYDQSKRSLVKTSMLSEIVLNSEMMGTDLVNIIYIPTVFRWTELLQTSTNVQNLLVYAMVHYATGDDIPLRQLPGEYTSLTLCFEKLD